MADSSNNNPSDAVASSDPAGSAENTVVENTAAKSASDATSTPDALGAAGTAGATVQIKSFEDGSGIIATRTKDKDNPTYQAVVKAYHSKHVADAILQTYKNAVQPAFSY